MKLRFAFIFGLVLAGGIVLAVILLSRPRDLRRQVLPDGAVLTLVEVQAGSRHYSPLASFRQKLAARLPASWHARLRISPPPSTYCEHSPSNYLSVWLTAESTNGAAPPKLHLLIGDERGNFTTDAEHHGRDVSVPLGSNVWLVGLPVAAWPRRAETLRIQVYAKWGEPMFFPKHGSKLLAEFRVPNPGRDTRTPAWTAPPWPITVRDGDLDFTLTSLWVGLGSFHGYPDRRLWPEKKNPEQRSTRATFGVTRAGEVLTNWNAHHVREIRDATGNWSDGNGFNSLVRGGETFNQFSRHPPPADEAWRLTVEFSRVSGFSTGELHTVQRVRVPSVGNSWGAQTNTFGSRVIEFRWEQRNSDNSNAVAFWATTQPVQRDHKLTLVRALDDRGREVPFKNSGGGESVTHEELKVAPDAVSLDMTFAFHRSRIVTFQAKPEFYLLGEKKP